MSNKTKRKTKQFGITFFVSYRIPIMICQKCINWKNSYLIWDVSRKYKLELTKNGGKLEYLTNHVVYQKHSRLASIVYICVHTRIYSTHSLVNWTLDSIAHKHILAHNISVQEQHEKVNIFIRYTAAYTFIHWVLERVKKNNEFCPYARARARSYTQLPTERKVTMSNA